MTVKPRTIDNLGVDVSIRYAKDQALFDPKLIQESAIIAPKAQISTAKPSALSEFDQTYSLAKTTSWALFGPPPHGLSYEKNLFSFQIIPSLGEYEKWESDSDKIEALETVFEKAYKGKRIPRSAEENEKNEKERNTLLALFRCLDKLNQTLELINARRNQYHKG